MGSLEAIKKGNESRCAFQSLFRVLAFQHFMYFPRGSSEFGKHPRVHDL